MPIMFVEWDRGGKLSRKLHPFGFRDAGCIVAALCRSVALFVGMRTKPVRFTREELEGHVEESYRPGNRGD